MLFLVQEKYGKDAKIEEDSSSGSEEDEDAMVRITWTFLNLTLLFYITLLEWFCKPWLCNPDCVTPIVV